MAATGGAHVAYIGSRALGMAEHVRMTGQRYVPLAHAMRTADAAAAASTGRGPSVAPGAAAPVENALASHARIVEAESGPPLLSYEAMAAGNDGVEYSDFRASTASDTPYRALEAAAGSGGAHGPVVPTKHSAVAVVGAGAGAGAGLEAESGAVTGGGSEAGAGAGAGASGSAGAGSHGAGAGSGTKPDTASAGSGGGGGGDPGGRNWTKEFVEFLCMDTSSAENIVRRSSMLCDLYLAFARRSCELAQTIVRELPTPEAERTFPPSSTLGGVAGGRKFVRDGILLKVANDDSHLYGSNEGAMKTAAHEIKVRTLQSRAVSSCCMVGREERCSSATTVRCALTVPVVGLAGCVAGHRG